MRLTSAQRLLVHQAHPAKLATDIAASVVSNLLLWRHQALAGLAVRYLAPPAGSVLVLSLADLDRLAKSPAAQYVLRHMPPAMAALRLAGDTLMALGAWTHRVTWMALGALLVVAGWLHGLLPHRRRWW